MSVPQHRQKNTVLIVDDEPVIRDLMASALSMAGLSAEVADNGRAGLESFLKHQPEICIVISDVVMPIMGGLDMADRILEIAPGAKILMMSGYSSAELEVKAQQRFPFIQKPFMPRDLLQKIRDVLGTEITGRSSGQD
jgi:two-component system, cell cycle sensor histidine kinase and response regulator CckA